MSNLKITPSPSPTPNKSQNGAAGANPSLGKRPRTVYEEQPPSIWDVTPWSPYLVVAPDAGQPKLSDLSVFKIQKALREIGAGDPKAVDRLGSGGLLVQVFDREKSKNLLSTKMFAGIAVSVQPHNSLNTSRGVVKSRDLDGCTAEELVEEVDCVIHARRMMRRDAGVLKNTNSWVLTFSSPKPPSKLRVAYLELEVRPYVPNPLRCFQCHRFGHSVKYCKRSAVCAQCGQGEHEEASCTAAPHCLNCRGDHSASSKTCPKWSEEKAILEYRANHGGTFKQARDCLFPRGIRQNQTYAKVVQGTAQKATFVAPQKAKDKPKTTRAPEKKQKSTPTPLMDRPVVPVQNRYAPLSTGEEEMEAAPSAPSFPPLSPSSSPLPSSLPPSPSKRTPNVERGPPTSVGRSRSTSLSRQSSPNSPGKTASKNNSRHSSRSPAKGAPTTKKNGGLKPGFKPSVNPKK